MPNTNFVLLSLRLSGILSETFMRLRDVLTRASALIAARFSDMWIALALLTPAMSITQRSAALGYSAHDRDQISQPESSYRYAVEMITVGHRMEQSLCWPFVCLHISKASYVS